MSLFLENAHLQHENQSRFQLDDRQQQQSFVGRRASVQCARVGVALFKEGRFSESAQAFSEAISEYSTEPVYYGNRALCFLELGFYERAAQDCRQALELEQNSVKFYYRLALALYGVGSISEALECLVKAYAIALDSNGTDDIDFVALVEEIDEIKERIELFSQSLSDAGERRHLQLRISSIELNSPVLATLNGQARLPRTSSDSTDDSTTRLSAGDSEHEDESEGEEVKAAERSKDPYADPSNPLKAYMLWIGNFSGPFATEKELKRLLKSFGGKTLSCTVFSHTSCALVTLQNHQTTGRVMRKLQGLNFHGTSLLVRYKLRAGEKAPIPTRDRSDNTSRPSNCEDSFDQSSSEEAELFVQESEAVRERPVSAKVSPKPAKSSKAVILGQPGESRTVWVGKLSDECSEAELRRLLSAAGPVCRVNLLRATRCAFVEFGDPDSAEAAVRAFSGRRFFGKIIRLNLACDLVPSNASAKLRNDSSSSCSTTNNESSEEQSNENVMVSEDGCDYKALWLGSLDDTSLNEADILRIFQKYRPISANVITKTSCGFVNFRNEQDAVDARRELNGLVIAGNSKRPIRIEFKVVGGFTTTTTSSSNSGGQNQSETLKLGTPSKAHRISARNFSKR